MIETYVSAALICAASMLVGRALLLLAGRDGWTWLEPAVGFGALLGIAGLLARAPGRGASATLGLVLLLLGAIAVLALRRRGGAPAPGRGSEVLRTGLPVAIAVAVVLTIPFAISERWGLLGVGFNNDLGLHLAWAEWLRSATGPVPETGYPLGPHGLAVAVAAVPGIGLGQAFVGEIFAVGILTGLTALAALPRLGPGRRTLAATMVAVPYLAASYFAQGAFKEMVEAFLVLAVAVALLAPGSPPAGRWPHARFALPWLALTGGVFFAYSFAGLAWPVAIVVLWSITRDGARRALAPRSLLRFLLRPATLVAAVLLAGIGAAVTLIGPFGFVDTFSEVAATNTYGPVSPVSAFGVWPTANYRLDAPGGLAPALAAAGGAIGALALLAGLAWWVRRRQLAVPIGLAACALLYLASLPTSGHYSQAKALVIAAPLAMLIAIRPLLAELSLRGRTSARIPAKSTTAPGGGRLSPVRAGWTVLAVAFVGAAAYSSFLALRDAPVGPPGHGAELRAFLPTLHGEPVLYAGQDRYAAHALLGADTHVPLVEFPDEAIDESPEKPFDTGDAYSPVDFDSFSPGTLDRFPYVITGRAGWNSEAPPNFRRIAATASYLLWERDGPTPRERRVLLEGTDAGAFADCEAPEIRILLDNPGRASLFRDAAIGRKAEWDAGTRLHTGERTAQTIRLSPGRWRLSLQYFSPFPLTLSAPPDFRHRLEPALDGQRPNTISLANDGQFWPAGTYVSPGGAIRFTIAAAEPTLLQRLSGYDDLAYVGNLVAVRPGQRQVIPLSEACNRWIDWYESPTAP